MPIQNTNQPEVLTEFKDRMKEARSGGEKFTQQKAAKVAISTLAKLHRKDGALIHLTEPQRDIIESVYYPTVEKRMSVLTETLKQADVELDETTEKLIRPLLNPAAVQKKLEEREKPGSKSFEDFLD